MGLHNNIFKSILDAIQMRDCNFNYGIQGSSSELNPYYCFNHQFSRGPEDYLTKTTPDRSIPYQRSDSVRRSDGTTSFGYKHQFYMDRKDE